MLDLAAGAATVVVVVVSVIASFDAYDPDAVAAVSRTGAGLLALRRGSAAEVIDLAIVFTDVAVFDLAAVRTAVPALRDPQYTIVAFFVVDNPDAVAAKRIAHATWIVSSDAADQVITSGFALEFRFDVTLKVTTVLVEVVSVVAFFVTDEEQAVTALQSDNHTCNRGLVVSEVRCRIDNELPKVASSLVCVDADIRASEVHRVAQYSAGIVLPTWSKLEKVVENERVVVPHHRVVNRLTAPGHASSFDLETAWQDVSNLLKHDVSGAAVRYRHFVGGNATARGKLIRVGRLRQRKFRVRSQGRRNSPKVTGCVVF